MLRPYKDIYPHLLEAVMVFLLPGVKFDFDLINIKKTVQWIPTPGHFHGKYLDEFFIYKRELCFQIIGSWISHSMIDSNIKQTFINITPTSIHIIGFNDGDPHIIPNYKDYREAFAEHTNLSIDASNIHNFPLAGLNRFTSDIIEKVIPLGTTYDDLFKCDKHKY
jgi:hypothetical protein